VATKKRKTPPQPRKVDHHAVTMLHGTRDTDEHDLGELHPDYGDAAEEDLATGATAAAMPSVQEEALLDLGSLNTVSVDSSYSRHVAEARGAENERRLTPTLLKIFSRRRQQIRLSLDQLSRISGISLGSLEALDQGKPGTSITYDQMVVLSRVLGVGVEQLPGLRKRETRSHLGELVGELERILLAAPLLRFEGKSGERYGGDVERAAASKAFTVRVEDESLEPALARGALLGFMSGSKPQPGAILLLRHRRSALLAMRRNVPPSYTGLVPWQPGYVVGGEWHLVGSLEVILPPR
jgi:transcriptional regulator with XRE-family HTH domain